MGCIPSTSHVKFKTTNLKHNIKCKIYPQINFASLNIFLQKQLKQKPSIQDVQGTIGGFRIFLSSLS
jgi:hypothetical protein